MELILHLGAHRTGSTALQRCMAANAAVLKRRAIHALGPVQTREFEWFRLATSLVNAPPEKTAAASKLAEGQKAMAAMLGQQGRRALLVSDENMLGTMGANLSRRDLYGDAAHRLRAYARLFGAEPTRIALAVRGYVDYWRSSYLFGLRREALPEFGVLAPVLAGLGRGWRDIVGDIRGVFPRAEIVVWTAEAAFGRVHLVLGHLLGIDGTRLAPVNRPVNAGPAAGAIPFLHGLRRERPRLTHADMVTALEGQELAADYQPFGPDATRALDARYADDLAHFAGSGAGVRFLDPALRTEGPNLPAGRWPGSRPE